MSPNDLKYHKEHTWARIKGKKATIGITHYAQESLGDIVYLELPEVDTEVDKDAGIAEIESTKATSPIIAPVSGKIIEVNEELSESPEIINEDPYEKGWIAVIEMSNTKEIEELLDPKDYDKYVEEEAK
ncbi:MAG: glycine cleavage system protein GcvH [Nitrospirae bacterium]|nr:glycine cleavage system protein GcvH [Nitrospirota bacterium]